jgi:site-specific recombinase XerD
MLGHDNLTTTQKYLALTEAEIAQDAQRADW